MSEWDNYLKHKERWHISKDVKTGLLIIGAFFLIPLTLGLGIGLAVVIATYVGKLLGVS